MKTSTGQDYRNWGYQLESTHGEKVKNKKREEQTEQGKAQIYKFYKISPSLQLNTGGST
jgi:hypothetical protein